MPTCHFERRDFQQGRGVDKRSSERFDAEGTVLRHAGHGPSRHMLSDLSVNGCRLSGIEQQIAVGSNVQLTLLSSIDVAGTVRWAKDGNVGIEFDDRLSEAAVKYFAFREEGSRQAIITLDAFGRRLPPLSPSNLPEPANR
jgi:hypothetical protein